jgi:hypothetical protein
MVTHGFRNQTNVPAKNHNCNVRADPGSYDSGSKSWPGQASEHDADHCETDESGSGLGITLEVAGEAPIAANPGERSLDDPAFRKHEEAVQFIALDDREFPGAGLGDGGRRLRPLVRSIGEDTFDEREEASRASIEDERCAVAILYGGRVDDDVQQQAERVDQDMPFAARDPLGRIKALRVKRGAPFCAALTL